MYKMVERMMEDGRSFSRNRNFSAFDDSRLKNATRIVRYLRSIQADLLAYGSRGTVKLTLLDGPRDGRSIRVEVDRSEVRGRREAYLNEDELRLLRLNPEVNRVIGGLLANRQHS